MIIFNFIVFVSLSCWSLEFLGFQLHSEIVEPHSEFLADTDTKTFQILRKLDCTCIEFRNIPALYFKSRWFWRNVIIIFPKNCTKIKNFGPRRESPRPWSCPPPNLGSAIVPCNTFFVWTIFLFSMDLHWSSGCLIKIHEQLICAYGP